MALSSYAPNLRLPAAQHGRPLSPPSHADYSKNEYEQKWGADCWWGKHVVVYGDAGLKKEHPVVAFLLKDK